MQLAPQPRLQPVCHVRNKAAKLLRESDMPYKQLFFRAEARGQIERGAAALPDAVGVALGPKSKCVLIGKKWGRPLVCNDGMTNKRES